MKLLFIIDQVYMHGGIERVLSIKANFLAQKKKVQVYIITTAQKGRNPVYEFHENITFIDLGINYQRGKSYFHPTNLLKLPKHIIKVRNNIKRVDPDIIIVCSHSTETYFMPFINKKIPKVKEFHYSKFIEKHYRNSHGSINKRWFLKFADFVESKYDRLVVLNKDEAAYYKSKNTIVIPNPLTFYPDQVAPLDSKIAIVAGRIAHVKRLDLLISIWKQVSKKNTEWQLHIYGTGSPDLERQLQEKIVAARLEDVVQFKGATNNIKSKMLEASLYLMTSENECFPLVLLEAQACGLPIIAFDCPHGPSNIVSPENGILIKWGNLSAFSESVLYLAENKTIRKKLGKHAKENSIKFTLESVMNHWETLFNSLTKNI